MKPVPAPIGATMNRKRVIVLTTLAVFGVLCTVAVLFFHAIPPWPVLLWFAVSHLFFCVVIARVKPYRGPYQEPMVDPAPDPAPRLGRR
jgi:hypothetical protein